MSIVRTLPGIDVREQVRAVGVLAHRLPGGVPLLRIDPIEGPLDDDTLPPVFRSGVVHQETHRLEHSA